MFCCLCSCSGMFAYFFSLHWFASVNGFLMHRNINLKYLIKPFQTNKIKRESQAIKRIFIFKKIMNNNYILSSFQMRESIKCTFCWKIKAFRLHFNCVKIDTSPHFITIRQTSMMAAKWFCYNFLDKMQFEEVDFLLLLLLSRYDKNHWNVRSL